MTDSIAVKVGRLPGEEMKEIEFEERDDGWYISPAPSLREDDDFTYADDGFTETPYADSSASTIDVGQLLRKDYDTRY